MLRKDAKHSRITLSDGRAPAKLSSPTDPADPPPAGFFNSPPKRASISIMLKYNITLVSVLISLLIPATLAVAQEAVYTSEEAFRESGYNYYWSIFKEECEQRTFETTEEAEAFTELMDIMFRTGTGFGHTYDVIDLGITQMYPRLLKLDPDPPLYAQYRHIGARFARGVTPEEGIQLGRDMQQVAARMSDAGYPPFFEGVAWLRAAHILSSVGFADDEDTKDAYETGLNLVVESASLEGVPHESREFMAYIISRMAYTSVSLDLLEKEELCYRLFDAETDPWVAYTSMGLLMTKKAWAARTNGFAGTINDARWSMFYQYLQNADAYLTAAWETRPEWVHAQEKMITVTMGRQHHPDRDEYFWFNEVTKVRPDLSGAHYNLARARRPKWGGSIQEVREILDDIADRSKSTPHLGTAYMTVLSELAKSHDDRLDVFQDPQLVDDLSRIAREHWSDIPENLNINGVRRTMRVAACANFIQGNYEQAREFLISGGAMAYRRHNTWKEPSRFFRWRVPLAIDDSGEVIKALQASDEGDLTTALTILKAFKEGLDAEPEKEYPHVLVTNPHRSVEQLITHIELHKRDN